MANGIPSLRDSLSSDGRNNDYSRPPWVQTAQAWCHALPYEYRISANLEPQPLNDAFPFPSAGLLYCSSAAFSMTSMVDQGVNRNHFKVALFKQISGKMSRGCTRTTCWR